MDLSRQTYTVDETSRLTGLSKDAVYEALKKNLIAGIKLTRDWLVLRQPLDQMLRGETMIAAGPDRDRFYRLVERLYGLGPRPIAELLLELSAERMLRIVIETKIERYVERLDLDTLKALGADKMPPMPLHVVEAAK